MDGGRRQIRNLRAGDRVWSLSSDGSQLVEDEIMCIAHAAPNILSTFRVSFQPNLTLKFS